MVPKVLKHLHSSYGCSWESALDIVKAADRKDAVALLLEESGDYISAYDILLVKFGEVLEYHEEGKDDEVVSIVAQLSGLCRRAAGILDWIPLVNKILHIQSTNNLQNGKQS